MLAFLPMAGIASTWRPDFEALLAEASFSCDLMATVALRESWMPVLHPGTCDKIYCVTGGGGWLRVGNDHYRLASGEVFFLPVGAMQQGEPDPVRGLEKCYLHFSAVTTRTLHLLRIFPPPVCLGGATAAAIHEMARELSDEWHARRPGRQLALRAGVMRLVLAAYRAPRTDWVMPEPAMSGSGVAAEAAPSDEHYDTVKQVLRRMSERLAEPLSLAELADHVACSPGHLSELFRRLVGMPPMRYLESTRMRRAQQLLTGSQKPIHQVAAAVGYADPNYFSRAFLRYCGVNPSAYRAAGRFEGQAPETTDLSAARSSGATRPLR